MAGSRADRAAGGTSPGAEHTKTPALARQYAYASGTKARRG